VGQIPQLVVVANGGYCYDFNNFQKICIFVGTFWSKFLLKSKFLNG